MNRFDKLLGKKRQAEVKYLDGEYQVMAPGDFVLCGVTGAPVMLEQLRYWSVADQEAYATAEAALQAEKKRRGR